MDVTELVVVENILISGASDNIIMIWDLISYQSIQTLRGHTGPITSLLSYSPGILASSSHDGTIKFWDMNTGKCEMTLKPHHGKNVGSLGIMRNGAIVSHGADGVVKFWSS